MLSTRVDAYFTLLDSDKTMPHTDAHSDVEAVKAMLDEETPSYPPETKDGIETEGLQSEHFDSSSMNRKRSIFRRAKDLIKNDAISRIFHLNDIDKVCIVTMFKKTAILVLGTGALAAPAITLWFTVKHADYDPFGMPGVESASHGGSNALQETFRWSVILSLSWAVYWACDLFLHVLPGLIRVILEIGILKSYAWLKRRLSPHVEKSSCQNACANVLDERARLSDDTWRSIKHFIALSPYITNVITSAVLSRAVATLVGTYDMYEVIQPNGKPQQPKWISGEFYLLNMPIGLFIFSVTFLLEKWTIQRLAIYFHSKNYKKRIEENNFALSTLHIIRSRVKKWRKWQAQQANRMKYEVHQPQSPLLMPILMNNSSKDTTLTGESEAIAQDVFDAIRHAAYMCCKDKDLMNGPRDFLIEDDFYPFCGTADAAKRFARMLDQDGNGDLTRREVLDGITRIYDERDRITQSLSCNSNYILKLDGLLLTLFLVCASFYWLSMFDASIWQSLTAIGGTALGLKFVFESSASSTFISIIFALVMHPYDIGDSIVIDNNPIIYTVLDVGLCTTTLNGPNGLIYVPNLSLVESVIGNLRRSEWQLDVMPVRITPPSDPKMLRPLLVQLESKLVDFALANPRDYQPNPRVLHLAFESSTAHAFNLIIPYKSNFYDGKLTDERRRRFVRHVLQVLIELEIEQAPINKDWGRVLNLT